VQYEYGGTDDKWIEKKAYILLETSESSLAQSKEVIASVSTGSFGKSDNYVYIIAGIHKASLLFGMSPHTLNPRLFNSFILALISIIVWRLSLKVGCGKQASLFAGYFCGLFPYMVFESSHLYRDIVISFGVILLIFIVVSLRYVKGNRKIFMIMALFPLLLFVSLFRSGLIVLFLMIFISAYRHKKSINGFLMLFTLTFFLLILSFLYLPEIKYFLNLTDSYFKGYTLLRMGQGEIDGIGVRIFTAPTIISIPLRIFYQSIHPVPFPTDLISENYHRLGTIIWYFSLPFLLSTLRNLYYKNNIQHYFEMRLTAIAFIIFYLVVAITTFQSRQITMYIPLAIPLIVYSMERSHKNIAKPIYIMIVIAFLMLVLYGTVKLF